MLVEVLDSSTRGNTRCALGIVGIGARWRSNERRVQGVEEGEGIEIAGTEHDSFDVFFDVGVCEEDGAVGSVEVGDFGEGGRWEGGGRGKGLAWRGARGDEEGWGADGADLGGEVGAGSGVADYEDFLGQVS